MKRTFIAHIFSAALLLVPLSAFAQLQNPLGYNSLPEFLSRILKLVSYIMGPIVTLFIIYCGFLFVSAGGDTKKLTKAREYFFWAVIGALIVLGAQALSLAIQATVTDLQRGL